MKSNNQINELDKVYKQLKKNIDLIKQSPTHMCADTAYGPFQASGTKEECDEKLKEFIKQQKEKNIKPIECCDNEPIRISEEYNKYLEGNNK